MINFNIISDLINQILKKEWDFEGRTGIYGGEIGLSLLYELYYRLTKDDVYKDKTYQIISKTLNNLSALRGKESMSGIAGIAWLLQYLVNASFFEYEDVGEYIQDLKSFIIDSIDHDLDIGNYDLMHGFIGKSLCLIEMLKNQEDSQKQVIIDKLTKSVSVLHNLAQTRENNQVFWYTNTDNKQTFIGMSHGVSGIVWYLSKLIELNILDKESENVCTSLIQKACNWMLEMEYNDRKGLLSFPTTISQGSIKNNYFLLAWCHGDFGIAISLIKSGQVLKNEYLIGEGIRVSVNVSKVKIENSRICVDQDKIDSSFCHGIFGAFYIIYLLYKEIKHEALKEAYEYWLRLINIGLEKKRQSDFFGLSCGKITINAEKPTWETRPGLLVGVSGNALVLLSHYIDENQIDINNYWHNIFL